MPESWGTKSLIQRLSQKRLYQPFNRLALDGEHCSLRVVTCLDHMTPMTLDESLVIGFTSEKQDNSDWGMKIRWQLSRSWVWLRQPERKVLINKPDRQEFHQSFLPRTWGSGMESSETSCILENIWHRGKMVDGERIKERKTGIKHGHTGNF